MSDAPRTIHPVGVISMGSNDLHLLVATSDGASTFAVQADHSLMVELAASLDGHLLPAASLSHALNGVQTLVELAHAAAATRVTALATEALREANNGSAFLALLAATFGIQAMVISSAQEAALDYCWARFPAARIPPTEAAPAVAQQQLVIDSGGGSTQVVLGSEAAPTWATSLPIGAGSLTAQLVARDPPKSKELHALAAHVASLVDALPRAETPVSVTTMGGSADHLLRLAAHPNRGVITRADLEAALVTLHQKPAAKVARDYNIPPERARLLPAGATILLHVMRHFALDVAQVKPHGIRGGFIVCYARAGDQWLHELPTPSSVASQRAIRKRR
jgi:exopolyphosphatase/guanosine-5'-triphosphate,3'-diphosphate pyrophosphatase